MDAHFPPIRKYDRTPHVEDSKLQPGDEGMQGPSFKDFVRPGGLWVCEEKVDGANSGFRFAGDGTLLAQSRGHYLDLSDRAHPRERDFTYFKDWLKVWEGVLLERFEDRYIVYGEWLGVTHTVFYDRLPHLFMEFDIFDLQAGRFLSTAKRRELCRGMPFVSVPVVASGVANPKTAEMGHIKASVGRSIFRTPAAEGDWKLSLQQACSLVGDDYEKRLAKVLHDPVAEGAYLKLEQGDYVEARGKWVRPTFFQSIMGQDEHWASRFQVPNLLAGPVSGLPHYLQAPQPGLDVDSYDADAPHLWGASELAPKP